MTSFCAFLKPAFAKDSDKKAEVLSAKQILPNVPGSSLAGMNNDNSSLGRKTGAETKMEEREGLETDLEEAYGKNKFVCGNGVLDPGEQCDDGNTSNGDGCSASCESEGCGDGVLQPQLGEQCDDGNTANNDGCSSACKIEKCGDGILQASEQCDDGNTNDGDGCSSSCVIEKCGDGVLQSSLNEECDDGNKQNGDGCSSACKLEAPAVCGDGIIQSGEECDDGNTADGDGCSSLCRKTPFCGDKAMDAGEECDLGDQNGKPNSGCDANCKWSGCGDGIVQFPEECDNGSSNGKPGNECNATCQLAIRSAAAGCSGLSCNTTGPDPQGKFSVACSMSSPVKNGSSVTWSVISDSNCSVSSSGTDSTATINGTLNAGATPCQLSIRTTANGTTCTDSYTVSGTASVQAAACTLSNTVNCKDTGAIAPNCNNELANSCGPNNDQWLLDNNGQCTCSTACMTKAC